jgi:hypothetical protein
MTHSFAIRPCSYCICGYPGKDGSGRHNKQSARRFVALDMSGNPTYKIIQPCRNHAACYADPSAAKNWRELPRVRKTKVVNATH